MADDFKLQNDLSISKKAKYVSDETFEEEKSQWWSRWKQSPPFIYQIFYRISGNASFGNGFEFCQPFETPEANGKDKLVPIFIFSKKVVNSCI